MATRKPTATSGDPIAGYIKRLKAPQSDICITLRKAIDTALPKATSKVWHAIPVWFIGENPVVGLHARPKVVTLLFWNGQTFDEPKLQASGSFKAAQSNYADVSEIELADLNRWLKKAGKDIWDLAGLRKKMGAAKKK